MKFKTELHLHSSDVSNCGRVNAETIVKNYLEKGYTTLVLTNHMSFYTFTNKRFDYSEYSWKQKTDYFMNGYKNLLAAAEGKLNILLGMELRSNPDGNDYLIYGVTEEFILNNPNMMDENISSVINACHEANLLVIQAHPFRNNMKICNPALLDGVEVYNGAINHDARNDIANMWADKFSLIKTSGTDYHEVAHVIGGGIGTDEPLTTNEQLVAVLKSGNYTLLRDSGVIY